MKKIILSVAIVTTVLSSCQKDKSTNPPPTSANKVKTYTEDITSSSLGNSVTTFNLAYDANDRVISVISTPSPDLKFLMSYQSGANYSLEIYRSTVLGIHEDFFYNSSFYLDSTFQYNDTEDTTTEKCFYDANNRLIKSTEYDYSKITGSELTNTITYNYDGDGNMIKSTGTDTNDDEYEYYADLVYAYPLISPPDAVNTQKHHLIKTHSVTSNGYPVGTVTYTYTFDNNNRISTEKQISTDGDIAIKTYTYF